VGQMTVISRFFPSFFAIVLYRPTTTIAGQTFRQIETGGKGKMFKRIFGLAIVLAILVLTFRVPIAYGQDPIGPKQAFKTTFAVDQPPADYDLLAVRQDFAPDAITPVHTHGGPAFITVTTGQLTLIQNGMAKTYSAGESWTETPGQFMQVANRGTTPASTYVTFLMPKGAPETTNQTGAAVPTGPAAKKSEIKFAIPDAPKQFDLIEVEQDFAPGSQTPVHTHGGPAYITVVSGELTLVQDGQYKTYKAGDNWTEKPGVFMQVVNRSSAPASTFVTFLLPKGSTLTTNAPQQAPAAPLAVLGASTPTWLWPSLGAAGIIILAGAGIILSRRMTAKH
jgi:quercetin dioxygenase-like cupin family protein